MVTACLIVHERSVPYLTNILTALLEALQDLFGQECRMVICSSVDSAETGNAELIFVIGENLGRFKRLTGRRYIYLNFSVVTIIGNPFKNSVKGIQLIRYKNRLLQKKLDLFDALLDYYPSQTRHLIKQLNIPVAGFVPWISPTSWQYKISLTDRPYDVCFVGDISPRRQLVLEKLRVAGCVMSPSSGVNAEETSAQSRCTLNLHMQRSNHLEIPRVMGAMATSPLITEDSYGIDELLPQGLIQVVPYRKLVHHTLATLANPEGLEETAKLARRWYCNIGAPRFKDIFMSAVKELQFTVRNR